MKNLKKMLYLLFACLMMVCSFNTSVFADGKPAEDPLAIKRKYVTVTKGFPFWQPVPDYIYLEEGHFHGYLGRIGEYRDNMGTVGTFAGYLYTGYPIPIPSKMEEEKNSASSRVITKRVTVYRHYKWNEHLLPYIYYDDGVFRGNLTETEMWQNSDYSWDVYYSGIVKKVPYIPTKVKEKSK